MKIILGLIILLFLSCDNSTTRDVELAIQVLKKAGVNYSYIDESGLNHSFCSFSGKIDGKSISGTIWKGFDSYKVSYKDENDIWDRGKNVIVRLIE